MGVPFSRLAHADKEEKKKKKEEREREKRKIRLVSVKERMKEYEGPYRCNEVQ